ncbi:MAG: glutamate mutase L [Candidatus Latescibacterota bacterium]|nr:glutamate mutase L [Candidatus Latescibacterota bacterium]
MSELKVIVATDCGSTTTKAILIEKVDGEYRQTYRGEAPTTVESPFEDVTRGVLNAIQEIEELSGREILEGEHIITPAESKRGVDVYISTSSAGGGLQMVVSGVIDSMSGESAQRCALGAGAIVMDVLCSNDGRLPHEKVERIRRLRPDMVLLAGGTDGGTVKHVVELAQYISAADPQPRFGRDFKLPVIFAGNSDATPEVHRILGHKTALKITENIRAVLEEENLGPARQVIHDLFLEHVMAQAPGYAKLMDWTDTPIMPTPAAVGEIIQTISSESDLNVIGVDIGGATTDVFSVFSGVFNRSVSANLGMSYSISNVLAESGLPNILRWIPFDLQSADLRDRIKNKMIRPTTVPHTLNELQIEQAVAREALKLAFQQHREFAVGLKGVQMKRTLSEVFDQNEDERDLIEMMNIDLIVGSGGVLSHAPRREQAMAMLVDAFQPEGVTRLAVDSIFMMPHLGVLSKLNARAATEVFERDCLVRLGTCVAPVGVADQGDISLSFKLNLPGGYVEGELKTGQIQCFPLREEELADIELMPTKGLDLGGGKGEKMNVSVGGGLVGLVIDARGRPLTIDQADEAKRVTQLMEWQQAMSLYEVPL